MILGGASKNGTYTSLILLLVVTYSIKRLKTKKSFLNQLSSEFSKDLVD